MDAPHLAELSGTLGYPATHESPGYTRAETQHAYRKQLSLRSKR